MSGRPRARWAVVFGLLLSVGALVAPAAAHVSAPAASPTFPPVVGNISGPTYVAALGNATYTINASGGPADVRGTLIGQINFTARVSGPVLTGVTVSPTNGSIKTLGTPATVKLTVSNVSETVTLEVKITSTLGGTNATLNLTYTVYIREPYTVRAVLYSGATATLPFTIVIDLDGVRVGNVSVPTLVPGQAYQIVFRYASPGLSPGEHTFTMSVVAEHGLVTFSGGLTSFSESFYIASAPPNNAVWYVAGAVAFFGALFIFATRVAARRRGPGKR